MTKSYIYLPNHKFKHNRENTNVFSYRYQILLVVSYSLIYQNTIKIIFLKLGPQNR